MDAVKYFITYHHHLIKGIIMSLQNFLQKNKKVLSSTLAIIILTTGVAVANQTKTTNNTSFTTPDNTNYLPDSIELISLVSEVSESIGWFEPSAEEEALVQEIPTQDIPESIGWFEPSAEDKIPVQEIPTQDVPESIGWFEPPAEEEIPESIGWFGQDFELVGEGCQVLGIENLNNQPCELYGLTFEKHYITTLRTCNVDNMECFYGGWQLGQQTDRYQFLYLFTGDGFSANLLVKKLDLVSYEISVEGNFSYDSSIFMENIKTDVCQDDQNYDAYEMSCFNYDTALGLSDLELQEIAEQRRIIRDMNIEFIGAEYNYQ